MIILEPENKIILTALAQGHTYLFSLIYPRSTESTSFTFSEFDGALYLLEYTKAPDTLSFSLSLFLPCFSQLNFPGKSLADYLKDKIPGAQIELLEPSSNYSIKVSYSGASPLDQQLINRFSCLKSIVLGYPFELAFDSEIPEDLDLLALSLRPHEPVYIKAQKDRVVVIFSLLFKDKADTVYAKVFIQVQPLHL